MKYTYRVRADLSVEIDTESQKEALRALAGAAEVFGEEKCGLCQSGRIVPQCRTRGKYRFYEWLCLDCQGTLSLGQLTEGDALYPVRRLDGRSKPDHEHGKANKQRGWTRYKGEGSEPPEAAPAGASAETAAPPPAPRSGLITGPEWDTIKAALQKSGIGQGTFLRWCGHKEPKAIPAADYDSLLAAAQKPPADLKSVAATPSSNGGKR